MANRNADGNVGFENLFLDRGIRVVLEELREVLRGGGVFIQPVLSLCSPEKRVLEEQRIGLGFLQPVERLLVFRMRVIVIAESKSGSLPPNTGAVFVGKGGELVIRAGNGAMQIAREVGKFFLCGGVLRSCSVESRSGSVGLATSGTRRRFRARGFLFFLCCLRGEIQRETEDQPERNEGGEPRASGTCRPWRTDIRRARRNRLRRGFRPSSDR